MSRTRKIVLGIVVLAILGVATAAAVARGSDRGAEVRVDTVQSRDLVSTITATGKVRARLEVNISSDVQGRVIELNVDEGDEVRRGDILLRIDPTQFQASLARARAALSQAEAQAAQQRANHQQAQRELERSRTLRARDPDLVTLQALEEAETRAQVQAALLEAALQGVEQNRAGVEEAADRLAKTTLRAPIDGRVTRRNIQEGETVVVGTMNNPGSLLLTVSDLSEVEAVLSVDETDIPQVSLGDSAVVELDAFAGRQFAGRVTKIGNSAIRPAGQATGAQASVDFEVILTLLDPPAELRPDLSATADIIVDSRSQVPSVPIIAVTVREDESPDAGNGAETPGAGGTERARGVIARAEGPKRVEGVFVFEGGKAVWRPVEIGITGREYFEVLSGLAVGDSVVSGPFQLIRELSDGAAVRLRSNVPGS